MSQADVFLVGILKSPYVMSIKGSVGTLKMNLLLTVKCNKTVTISILRCRQKKKRIIKPSLSNKYGCKGYKTLQCCQT